MVTAAPDIYSFTDWQLYLREWVEHRRLLDPQMSLQNLALQLGLRAKSHLHRLLHDEGRTLAVHLVEPLADVMDLVGNAREYWVALNAMSRARTLEERNKQYGRMHRLHAGKRSSALRKDQFEYFGTWYLPVLREAVVLSAWRGDYAKLARFVEPPITESQAKRGVELLVRLGLLEPDGQKGFRQSEAIVQAEPNAGSLALANFQHDMLRMAERSLEKHSREEREISTLTFSIPRSQLGRIRELMRKFQQELASETLSLPGAHDSVFQLNLQCFPLSAEVKRKGI